MAEAMLTKHFFHRTAMAVLIVVMGGAILTGRASPGQRVSLIPASAQAATTEAIINVSVATLWAQPNRLRSVDAPSAANPVNIPQWLSRMSTADRQWLVGRVQTQALYGTQVAILAQSGSWTRVAVEDQPTNLHSRGYPGWLPSRQLTRNLSLVKVAQTHPVAIVTARLTWLRRTTTLNPSIRVSYGTRLAVLGSSGNYDLVATPAGGKLAIAKRDVALYRSLRVIRKPTGAQIVAGARAFLGLRYLWGGTSGFGFDCSGLTYIIYYRYGIALPRDADRQALRGRPVSRASLRPGDLIFYAGAGGVGFVHHVAIYAGGGQVVESPNPTAAVRILGAFTNEYAGARRYL